MEIRVLDQNFNSVHIFDEYESLLWVDRLWECGSFEIYTPINDDILTYMVKGNYLVSKDTDHVMIIEDFAIDSDVEIGDHIKIIGRSLESILDRRIVWSQTNLDGSLQDGISKLLYANIIGGDGTEDTKPRIVGGDDRKITNFIFEPSSDPTILSLTMENQYTGEDLLTVIQTLCETNKIGFKILLNDNNQFVFSLYNGIDKSYRQNTLPYVVFRPTFDNIINSNYKEENSKERNVTLVAGEGEGASRKTRTVGSASGLLRKELFTDARDIQKEGMTDAKYNALLDKRGQEKLSEANRDIKTFDGQCDTTSLYVYNKDFKMGDIVQIANEYGMESPARITEFTWNYSTSGIETYPTFVAVEEEESD